MWKVLFALGAFYRIIKRVTQGRSRFVLCVWEIIQFVSIFEETWECSLWRETFFLWPMWSNLCTREIHQNTHTRCSHRGKVLFVPSLWKMFYCTIQVKVAPAGSNWRKPLPMQAFSMSSSLQTHQLVHSGLKPFSCKQCNRTFTQAGALKIHTQIHTGEKPYSCS